VPHLNPDQQAIVHAPLRDVATTLGGANSVDLVLSITQRAHALLDVDSTMTLHEFRQEVIDDCQQQMYDEFIERWPHCPRHPNHPLWLTKGVWRCTRDDVTVAPLGELSSLGSERG
jgi:hypothetical protein